MPPEWEVNEATITPSEWPSILVQGHSGDNRLHVTVGDLFFSPSSNRIEPPYAVRISDLLAAAVSCDIDRFSGAWLAPSPYGRRSRVFGLMCGTPAQGLCQRVQALASALSNGLPSSWFRVQDRLHLSPVSTSYNAASTSSSSSSSS